MWVVQESGVPGWEVKSLLMDSGPVDQKKNQSTPVTYWGLSDPVPCGMRCVCVCVKPNWRVCFFRD